MSDSTNQPKEYLAMAYELSKISATTWHTDGSPCYDWTMTYATWKQLVLDLACKERFANECFYGKGSHIFQDGERIGHTSHFSHPDVLQTPMARVTRQQFLAAVADDE